MTSVNSFDTGWCEVLVKRTKRQKSACIRVKDNQVQVNIPQKMAAIDLQLLLEKKRGWIEETLNKQYHAKIATRKYLESGELFLFQGKRYPLQFKEGALSQIYLSDDNYLTMVCPELNNREYLFEQLVAWYQHQAAIYLTEKTNFYAHQLRHHPASIHIKSYRSRWGSCSVRGDIQYNWRLIMAPLEVIDYVIVHELCHLIEHNHSAQFWRLVASLDEHYQMHRQWLKQQGDFLCLQFAKT